MPLTTVKGTLVAPTTASATSTITVADCQAVVLFASYDTGTTDAVDGHGILSVGVATRDAGSIQQGYITGFDTDALGTSSTAIGMNSTAALKGFSASTPTVDYVASVTTFTASQVVITWTDPPASAIIVHYWCICGTSPDLTGAKLVSATAPASGATWDLTVGSGWGQPAAGLFITRNFSASVTAFGDVGAAAFAPSLGVFSNSPSLQQRYSVAWISNAAATMDVLSNQGAGVGMFVANVISVAARSTWPTDGLRFAASPGAFASDVALVLALKGSLTATASLQTAPTAVAPQTLNVAHGTSPAGALVFGTPIATTAGNVQTDANLGGLMIGATDGINQGCCGITQDDANTTSFAGRHNTDTYLLREFLFGATGTSPPALQSSAAAAISGNNVALTWDVTDTVAREFEAFTIGPEPSFPARLGWYGLELRSDGWF